MRSKLVILGTTLLTAAACGGSSLDQTTDGSFAVALSGAGASDRAGPQTDSMAEIVVTVSKVTAQVPGQGWITLSEDLQIVDILQLGDHAVSLGFADLPEGQVNQIRLHLASEPAAYVVTDTGETHPLRVPSGEQSGIKILGPWTVSGCGSTTVVVSISGHESLLVVGPGHGQEYILRPVIKSVEVAHDGCDDVTEVPGDDPSSEPGDTPGDTPGDDDGAGGDDGGDGDADDGDDSDDDSVECRDHEDCFSGYCADGYCIQLG